MIALTVAGQAAAVVAILSSVVIPNMNNRAYAASGAYTGVHGSDAFVMLVKTDNAGSSNNNQFTIPTSTGTYNYNVDCDDDGSFDATGVSGSYTCNYGSSGTYSVVIEGAFPHIYFADSGDKLKLLEVQQWGNLAWNSFEAAFAGAANFNVTATDAPTLTSVTNLSGAFSYASSFNADISHWNTSSVVALVYTFRGASSFNQPLNNWDTGNVQAFWGTFQSASSFNQPLNNWDTGNATRFDQMFNAATSFNQDIDSWDVSSATHMSHMFTGASAFNSPLNGWDTTGVVAINNIFEQATSFNQPLDNWDVSEVDDLLYAFHYATSFNADISTWDVGNVWRMTSTFGGASSFNQDISSWDVSSVTRFDAMFQLATAFNQDISTWDVSNADRMDNMFGYATSFNQDISTWNTSNVTNMSGMFSGAQAFNRSLNAWDVSNVTNMSYTFFGATNFNGDISDWNVANVNTMQNMFNAATVFNQDISGWDTGSVTITQAMFIGANAFNQDLSTWNVENLQNASGMLDGASISSQNYEAAIIAWSQQSLQNNVTLGAAGKVYCAAASSRQSIIDTYNWTINDGGQSCEPVISSGSVVSVSDNSAVIEFEIIEDGGGTVNSAGVYYGLDMNNGSTQNASDFNEGIKQVELQYLDCATTYYYRTYIQTPFGEVFGDYDTFTTDECPPPPVLPDIKLDITLNQPGLIQGQQANYVFKASHVSGDPYDGSSDTSVLIVAPDGFALMGDEDDGLITDYETYGCVDITEGGASIPAFAYHLGKLYQCFFVSLGQISAGDSTDMVLPFMVNSSVDSTTTMRAMFFGEDADIEALYGAFAGEEDIFTLPINNIAVYAGTQAGTTIGQGSSAANQIMLSNPETNDLVLLQTPSDTQLTCSSTIKESINSLQDQNYAYPLGLVSFCFDTEEVTNQVDITFVTDLRADQVKARKYNPNNQTYIDIPNATITETILEGERALRLTYAIEDNGLLDLNPESGSITDPVGLAVVEGSLADTGLDQRMIFAAAIITTVVSLIGAKIVTQKHSLIRF